MGFAPLAPFVLLGLAGAVHCAGMCGGFAIAVSQASGTGRWRALRGQLLFTFGKALTYGVLGLAIARAGDALATSGGGERLDTWRQALAWFAGAVMILFGVLIMRSGSKAGAHGLRRLGRFGWALETGIRGVQRLFAAARDLPGAAGALGTGLVSGLLPCGLSWGALALAATVDPLTAFLGMLAFGAGTTPVLVFVGLGWRGFSKQFRGVAVRAAGPLLVVFGLYTVVRGASLLGPESSTAAAAVLPDCCAQGSPHDHESP